MRSDELAALYWEARVLEVAGRRTEAAPRYDEFLASPGGRHADLRADARHRRSTLA